MHFSEAQHGPDSQLYPIPPIVEWAAALLEESAAEHEQSGRDVLAASHRARARGLRNDARLGL